MAAEEDDDPIKVLSSFERFTSYELLLMLKGRTPEQAKAESADKTRINALADKIKGKPTDQWPPFDIVWDTAPESYFRTLDGKDSASVDPANIEIVWIELRKLDSVLEPYNRRTVDEVWSVGDANKAARALVHWSEGRAMSPAWIAPTTAGKVGIVGGNHRLAIARAKGVTAIPVLVEKKDLEIVSSLIEFVPEPER